MGEERIQKVLAAAGYGARRSCELLVLDGRVKVNGHVVRTLPILVDLERDRVVVDGKGVRRERLVYYVLHKPRGVLCTHMDPAGRKRAVDLLVGVRERVFPVGRLDADSAGLLIMTNDGALAQKLAHPRFSVPKTYRVEISGSPGTDVLRSLRAGVWLSEGKTSPAAITVVHKQRNKAILEMALREGRNREIRRMLAKAGYKVRRLTRIRVGKISIRGLSAGAFRRLSPPEVRYLRSLSDRSARDGASPPARSRPLRPGRSTSVKPVRRAKPARSTSVKPIRPAKPGRSTSVKPVRRAKPARSTSVKPVRPAKPGRSTSVKPIRRAKPARSTSVKPVRRAKPARSTAVKPVRRAKPARSTSVKPVRRAKPARSTANKPARPAKRGRSTSNKPARPAKQGSRTRRGKATASKMDRSRRSTGSVRRRRRS